MLYFPVVLLVFGSLWLNFAVLVPLLRNFANPFSSSPNLQVFVPVLCNLAIFAFFFYNFVNSALFSCALRILHFAIFNSIFPCFRIFSQFLCNSSKLILFLGNFTLHILVLHYFPILLIIYVLSRFLLQFYVISRFFKIFSKVLRKSVFFCILK